MKKLIILFALLSSSALGQVFPNFPIVGSGSYSCGQNNSVTDCTVPAGPPALTGNETLLLDTNLPNGEQPSTVLSTVDTLKDFISSASCPTATIFIKGCVRPDGTTIVISNGIISSITAGTGTVTSITAGTGLSGGTITLSGTIALADTSVSPGTYNNATLTVNAQGQLTFASNGAATGTVTSITAGTGLIGGTITNIGTISLANTAVSPGSYTSLNATIDAQGRITAASSGSGTGTVTSIITGTGLSGGPITTSGTINLANTAVSAGSYTNLNATIDAQGRITFASNGTAGSVTSVATGTGLTGGPITGSGTISLANTAVSAGSYTNANITVDAQGRLTSAANGSTSGLTVGVTSVSGSCTNGYNLFNNSGILGCQVSGAVTSVSAGANGSLTISPTVGAVIVTCTTATTIQLGCTRPDGITITASTGVISTMASGATSLINHSGSTVTAGSPVYLSASGQFDPARANSFSTSGVIALLSADVLTSAPGTIITSGILTLTTGQWDAVTGGSGGLTFNTLYFLDPTTAGKLTTTAPSTVGQVVTLVGRAISSTIMLLGIQSPIQL